VKVGEKLRVRERPTSFIREVILENFMSYEYARIPFIRGLNIICGPNGSGKSSILLGMSVALGQVYTERARRLSDLIRRGKDLARVTLIFDNRPVGGRRPIPFSRSDSFMLSRYLRKDGSYWFEADFREASLAEVGEILRDLGINPNNMLMIMHQGMVEEFAATPAEEKLRMLEDIMELTGYREMVAEAQRRLQAIATEESSIQQLMEMARETLEHWRETYGRFLKKRELLARREALARERFWAQISRLEKIISSAEARLEAKRRSVEELSSRIAKSRGRLEELERDLRVSHGKLRKALQSLALLESSRSSAEARGRVLGEAISSFMEVCNRLSLIKGRETGILQGDVSIMIEAWRKREEEERRRVADVSEEISALERMIPLYEEGVFKAVEGLAAERANLAVLSYERKQLEREVSELRRSIEEPRMELASLESQKAAMEPRLVTERAVSDVDAEIASVEAQLAAYADVPDEAKDIFESYRARYMELKEKLSRVSENKRAVMEELEKRKRVWKESINRVLDAVNPIYEDILAELEAFGKAKLVNEEDFERTGLDLSVGFRGSAPTVLDAYTLSGGERTVAIVSFLLALQRLTPSPILAIDEFDVHMDPLNRERILSSIIRRVEEEKQYFIITPGQLGFIKGDVNYVVVQMVGGKTEVGILAEK